MAGTTGNYLVREALYGQLQDHTAGVLADVLVLRHPPEAPEDQYGTSRKVVDQIWLTDSRSVVGTSAQCGDGVEYQEDIEHVIVIQVTRLDNIAGTQDKIDARCDSLLADVLGILGGDPSLGIDLTAYPNMRYVQVVGSSWEYRRTPLQSGGRDAGHAGAYILTVRSSSASLFNAPALP